MGKMAWGYGENYDMELGQKPLEEMMNNNQLISPLKSVIPERDEARDQLHKLLNEKTSFISPQPDSLLDPYNHHPPYGGSSPVESLFDFVSSPDLNMDQEFNANNHFSQLDSIMDGLASGRVLPPKGKFLQGVLQAGPLLQTLMPLPRWRNPPQLQPFQIPPAPPVSNKQLDNASVMMNTSDYSP